MFNEEAKPLTNEVYCFTSRVGVCYHTLALSPLYTAMVGAKPDVLRTQVGEHVFIGESDQPTYLIPYDHKMCAKYSLHYETLNLFIKQQKPEGLLAAITVPMSFGSGIMPYFTFKISNDGKLFKREGIDQWILCKL